jgi:predicted RNA binding protein YcfA (HicA-like mRNA interferase family)
VSRLAAMTYRDIVRRLRAHGFAFERPAKGSHEIWYSQTTRRRTTVACHPGSLPVGTTRAIIRATGLSPEEFLAAPPPREDAPEL